MKIPYSKFENVFAGWVVKAILPGFPLHIQVLAGLSIPEASVEVKKALESRKLIQDDYVDIDALSNALNYIYQFTDSLKSEYSGVMVEIRKEHVNELLSAFATN